VTDFATDTIRLQPLSKSIGRSPPRNIHNPSELIFFARWSGQRIDRPWLTIVIDDYSRAIAGYYLGFDPPSSTRTALALRQAIWRKGHSHWHVCGIPEVLYTDNGSDFTSKHIEQVAVDLKIRLVFSTPGKPQGRGRIERFFRTVNEMFLVNLMATATKSAINQACHSSVSKRSFEHSFWRRTTADPASRQGQLPRNDGRKAGSCRACPSRSSSLTSCLCRKYALARCVAMAFISKVCDISRSSWPRTLAKM